MFQQELILERQAVLYPAQAHYLLYESIRTEFQLRRQQLSESVQRLGDCVEEKLIYKCLRIIVFMSLPRASVEKK
jgi:hypothetical protein